MELGMGIEMLGQILFLSKWSSANITFESFEAKMDGQEVSLQAETGGELFAAARHRAHRLLGIGVLVVDHLIKLSEDLLLCFFGQLLIDFILLQLVLDILYVVCR